jgi:3-mercaptopyruvate sulfurtransferase SseA
MTQDGQGKWRSDRIRWLLGFGLLAILGLVSLGPLLRPGPGEPSPTPTVIVEPNQPEVVERVSLADAKAALDAGTAVFVDVRSAAEYEQGHIPGALWIPGTELEDRLGELDPSAWIITYCT